jgi:hypothetical protein
MSQAPHEPSDHDAVAAAADHSEEIELLERVLMPLGEARCAEILELAKHYLENVSPIMCAAGFVEPGDPVPTDSAPRGVPGERPEQVTWRVGAPSPLDPAFVVFAIFEWPEMHCLVAYSISAVAVEGDDRVTGFYHREKIYRPRYAWGPLSLSALYHDLVFHLDLEEPASNGKG